MFFLHFRILAEVMFFARTTENQRGDGNGHGGFAKPKMHSAPQTKAGGRVLRKVKALRSFLLVLVIILALG